MCGNQADVWETRKITAEDEDDGNGTVTVVIWVQNKSKLT